MNMQLRMAARYLWGRKLRTFMTTLAIVLGVMLVFGLNGLLPAFMDAFRRNMLATAGQVDLMVSSETRGGFDSAVLSDVQRVDGIAAATGLLQRNALLPAGEAVSTLTITGVDPATVQEIRAFTVVNGRFLQSNDSNTMLISENLAEQVGLTVGDTLTLPSAAGSADFEIVGILSTRALPGVEEVYIPLPAAQTLFNEPGQISAIEATLMTEADKTAVEQAVLSLLGTGYKLGGQELGEEFFASMQIGQAAFTMFGVMALIMGGFIIFNTFRTVVAERRRDIGLLRAVGASRRAVVGIILVESLLQGILGTGLGLLLGYLLAVGSTALMQPIFTEFLRFELGGPVFSTGSLITAVFLGIGVTVAGGLYPAIAASRVMPLEALRPVVANVQQHTTGRGATVGAIFILAAIASLVSGNSGLAGLGALLFLVGLMLVAPALVHPIARIFGGLLTMIFVREGQIAQGNLTRQPGRAAVTASTMMIGLAIVVALLGLVASLLDGMIGYIDKSLGADWLLMPTSIVLNSGNVGAGPELAQKIADTEGIEAVATLRVASSQADSIDMQVLGIDPTVYPEVSGIEFSAGDEEASYAALQTERAMVVNGIFASQNQVQVGDVLTLKTIQGDQDYRVVGIGIDYLNAKLATGYISQENLATDFNQTTDVLLMANMVEGADETAVKSSLQELAANYPAFTLVNSTEWRNEQQKTFQMAFSVYYVLMGVLALPSLIALINTLGINVIERTREIGMVRAVGGTQKQVRRMILAESLLLSATGTGFGILAGIWLGYALVGAMNASGFVFDYYFPTAGILAGIAVGLIFGVIAAMLPARQAARLDIVEALRYE